MHNNITKMNDHPHPTCGTSAAISLGPRRSEDSKIQAARQAASAGARKGVQIINSTNVSAAQGARLAFTPTEFAAMFGRHATWGYRQLYAGHIKAIRGAGRILIPLIEIERFTANTAVYAQIVEELKVTKQAGAQNL